MDEKLKKDFTPVIEYIVGNFKNYIDGNFSMGRNVLFGDLCYKFSRLDIRQIKSLVDHICLRIEIDALASGIKIKDLNIILKR